MGTQEDLTAFANQFGLYIDIRPCEECLNPKGDSEHGFDCDEYKAIYGWVESRVREQIAGEIEERKLLVIEQSKIGVQPEDADFYRKIFERAFNDAAAIARGNL